MGLSTIALNVLVEYDTRFSVQLEPMLYLSLCLSLALFGFFSYTDKRSNTIIIENVSLLRWLEGFQLVTSIGALIFFLPFALDALTGDIDANRWDVQSRQEVLGSYGLINSFFSLVGVLFVLSIILAFVNLATIGRGGSRLRATALLTVSAVYIVYILAYVGRDGFVYWTMTFIFFYLMFKDFMLTVDRRRVKRIALILAMPALVTFVLITVGRVSSDAHSVLASLLEYSGSQIYSFNDHYLLEAPPMMGLVNFSQFLELGALLSGSEKEVLDRIEWYRDYTDYGVRPWIFTTLVGSFLLDFGREGTLLLITFIAACGRITLRRQNKDGILSFSRLLIFVFLSQIVLWGVFYYRHYAYGYYLIAMMLIAILFKVFHSQRRVLVLKKIQLKNKASSVVPISSNRFPVTGSNWQRY
jgi:oligosaccharide repeat unit polymerase